VSLVFNYSLCRVQYGYEEGLSLLIRTEWLLLSVNYYNNFTHSMYYVEYNIGTKKDGPC